MKEEQKGICERFMMRDAVQGRGKRERERERVFPEKKRALTPFHLLPTTLWHFSLLFFLFFFPSFFFFFSFFLSLFLSLFFPLFVSALLIPAFVFPFSLFLFLFLFCFYRSFKCFASLFIQHFAKKSRTERKEIL